MLSLPQQPAARIGLNVLLLLAGVVALRLGESVIIPLLIALLLASVLGPAANWLHDTFKIRWSVACILVIFGLVLVNVLVTLIFSLTIARLVGRLPRPNDNDGWIALWNLFRMKIEQVSPWPLDEHAFPRNPANVAEIRFFQYVLDLAPRFVQEVLRFSATFSWNCIIILFTLFFVLLEGRMLARRVVEIFGPSRDVQTKAEEVLSDMARQVRTYLVWRTIINFGLAVVMGLIYQMAGLREAWTWAVLLSILNYVPYLGPLIAGLPPFVDAFFSASPAAAVVVTIVYVGVIVVEGYLVVPLLMGRNMDINATTVMMACLFWDLVWGMTGLFLAMPIMAGIKAILYHVPEWRPWANLMSSTDDEEEEPPPILPLPPPAPSQQLLADNANSANGKLSGSHPDIKTGSPADAGSS